MLVLGELAVLDVRFPARAVALRPLAAAQLRDSFEGPQPSWLLQDADCGVKLLGKQRDYRHSHGGQASENIRLAVGNGTFVHLVRPIGRAPVIAEFRPSLYLRADRPSLQLLARVVFPRSLDPGTRQPVTALLQGDLYTDVGEWQAYKFEITGPDGKIQPLKADPFAFASELRPKTASMTVATGKEDWGDAGHRAYWASVDPRRAPISIYEVHAGSWQRDEHDWFLSWDALADRLIPYVVEMGFTHIEFLPISEHPYDPSWGYQTTGLYAPSARFGEPAAFARFVDGAHRAGIGVILDWVPAHFPTDAHGLVRFDGTALYEHEDPRLGHHPDWDTAIYNFGRREVSSFLVNNALFWAERYHVDGLRVDAVASMLYRDYSRAADQWIPNQQGGRENWEILDQFPIPGAFRGGKLDGPRKALLT